MGAGERSPQEMKEILEAKNREAAGPTAPAKGLTMIGIEFEKILDTHGSVYYNI